MTTQSAPSSKVIEQWGNKYWRYG